MICKFENITGDQLAELGKYVDGKESQAVCWSEDGSTHGHHPMIEILKTPVKRHQGQTVWHLEFKIREAIEQGAKGVATVPVPRHILIRCLHILGRFPWDLDGRFRSCAEESPKKQVKTPAVDEQNFCPVCGHLMVRNGRDYRCHNCGQYKVCA